MNIRVILLWGVLGRPYGVSWQSLGRLPRVLSGFLAVSFSTFGLPAGFQPHSTPALAPALRSHPCIDSPLRGGECTNFNLGTVASELSSGALPTPLYV